MEKLRLCDREQHNLWLHEDQCRRLQKRFGDYDTFQKEGGNKENKKPIFETMNKILDEGEGKYSLLDVGCGPGHFMWSFKEKASKLIGLDYSPYMLDLAQTQLNLYNIETEFHVGSTWFIPLEDDYVDVSLQVDVCMHIGGSWEAISEMIRVSKKYVVFTGPSFENFSDQLNRQIGPKSWAVSIPLLEENLFDYYNSGKVQFWKWIKRPESTTYKHRILLIGL